MGGLTILNYLSCWKSVALLRPFRTSPASSICLQNASSIRTAQTRSISSSSTLNLGPVANSLVRHKSIIGPHTVILSHDDEHSLKMRENLWVELQKIGIQSVFSSVSEPVASSKSMSETAYFIQRSGARSLIALGNGALCDLATSVRKSIERGPGAVETGIDASSPGKALSILAVPTNASPSYFYDTALLLNGARDVFSSVLVRPPEVVLFDTTYTRRNLSSQTSAASLVYLFAELLDTVFAAEYAVAVTAETQREPSVAATELSRVRALYSSHLANMGIVKNIFEVHPADGSSDVGALIEAFARVASLRQELGGAVPGLHLPLSQARPVQMRSAYSVLRRVPFRDYQDHACVSLLLLLECFHITKSGAGPDYTALRNTLGALCRTSAYSVNNQAKFNSFDHAEVLEQLHPFLKRLRATYLPEQVAAYRDWTDGQKSSGDCDIDEFRIAEEMALEQLEGQRDSSVLSSSRLEFIKGDMFGDYCAATEVAAM